MINEKRKRKGGNFIFFGVSIRTNQHLLTMHAHCNSVFNFSTKNLSKKQRFLEPNESNLGIHIYSKVSIKNSCFRRNSLERKRWKILQPFKLARLIPSHERFLAISFSREELPRLEFPIHAFLNKFFFPFIQSSSKKPRLNWVILLIWLTIIFLTNCWWSLESNKKMNYFIYSWQRFYSSLNLTVSFPGQNFYFRIEDKMRRDYPRKGIKDIQAVLEITTRKVERESNGADKRGRVTCNSGGVSR